MFRWVEHTGELEVEIEAESETGVFEQGVEAMRELLTEERADQDGAVETRRVTLRGEDRPGLLADWFGELAFLAESEGFVAERVAALELGGDGLVAELVGSLGKPPHLVKAATYHRLAFERSDAGWRARVVLDV